MLLAMRLPLFLLGSGSVGVSVVLNAKALTPRRTPAVDTVRSHPPWGEHSQPDPTAAIGASSRSGISTDPHLRRGHRWHTMHVNCLDVPRAQGHIEDIKAKYGEASKLIA